MVDIQSNRKAIAVLEESAGNATGLVRQAILASVAVAKRCLDDVEKMQVMADDAVIIMKASREAVAEATANEEQAVEDLAEAQRAQRKAIAKAAVAFEEQAMAKSIADVVKAWNDATPLLAELLAIRRWTHRADSQLSVLSDLRKGGEVQVRDPSDGSITVIVGKNARAQAIALVKHYVAQYVDLEPIRLDYIGINDDRPEPKNQGRDAWNGAPSEQFPGLDNGPKIYSDDED